MQTGGKDRLLDRRVFRKGETIFAEGAPGDAAYIVERGAIGIFKTVEGEQVQLATLRDAEIFGEMAVIDGGARMASAVAIEESTVIRIGRETLESKLARADPFVRGLIGILIDSLRGVHKAYIKRPRSLQDTVKTLAFLANGLRDYARQPAAANIHDGLRTQADALAKVADGVAALAENHQDRRRDAVPRVSPVGESSNGTRH
jgi:CRP-like cAMP-binding protein